MASGANLIHRHCKGAYGCYTGEAWFGEVYLLNNNIISKPKTPFVNLRD